MSADSLDDDMVKLVSYTIVTLKRGEEKVMPGGLGNIVVAERMTDTAFSVFMITTYLESQRPFRLPSGDEQYLRVFFVVTHSWPRQPLHAERRELASLEAIRSHLAEPAVKR